MGLRTEDMHARTQNQRLKSSATNGEQAAGVHVALAPSSQAAYSVLAAGAKATESTLLPPVYGAVHA